MLVRCDYRVAQFQWDGIPRQTLHFRCSARSRDLVFILGATRIEHARAPVTAVGRRRSLICRTSTRRVP